MIVRIQPEKSNAYELTPFAGHHFPEIFSGYLLTKELP